MLLYLLCLAQASALVGKPWMVRDVSPEDRARALLGVMTLEEKIAMLHGYNSPNYTGLTLGNARLSIPPLNMNDGRQGFRPNNGNNKQSSFPCELSTVATFDKELYYQFGEAMGEEFAGKGGNVMLAPMLILARVPQGGRNFESTGECPELAYHFAKNMITGVQSVPGVIANADDFVLSTFCHAPSLPPSLSLFFYTTMGSLHLQYTHTQQQTDNQETDRTSISAWADQRTLFELYYRGYKGAIDANVGSFMCRWVHFFHSLAYPPPSTTSHVRTHYPSPPTNHCNTATTA